MILIILLRGCLNYALKAYISNLISNINDIIRNIIDINTIITRVVQYKQTLSMLTIALAISIRCYHIIIDNNIIDIANINNINNINDNTNNTNNTNNDNNNNTNDIRLK